MEEIIEALENNYRSEWTCENKDEKARLEFLNSFLSQIDITDYNSILKMNKQDFLLAYLSTNKENIESFSSLHEKVKKLFNINSVYNGEYFYKLTQILLNFVKRNSVDELSQTHTAEAKDKNISKLAFSMKEEYREIEQNNPQSMLNILHIQLSQGICKSEEERQIFFELLKNYPKELLFALLSIMTIDFINEEMEKNQANTTSKKILNKAIQEKLCIGKVALTIKGIEEEKNNLVKELKEHERNEKKRKKRFETIKRELLQLATRKNITFSPQLLELIKSEEVKFLLLKHSLLHNRDGYLEAETILIKENSLSILEKIFKKYNFNFNLLTDEEKELLTKFGNIDSIDKILDILSEPQFSFLNENNFPIVTTLILATSNTVSTISKLISQDFLKKDFVINNPTIFYDDVKEEVEKELNIPKGTHFTLLENIALLKEKKIKIKKVSEVNPSLLIQDSEFLKQSMKKIDKYHLNYSKATSFAIIENPNLTSYIDLFIELGLYKYIKNNPELINGNSINLINRIILCKQLDIPIFEGKKLTSVITGSAFKLGNIIIDDNTVAEYIENSVFRYANDDLFQKLAQHQNDLYDPVNEIETLLPFKEDEQTYNIDGILISRNKVLHNYSILKDEENKEKEIIFNSLIYGSILDNSKLETIRNAIFSKEKKKEKINI